jgi:hypothetical protein
LKEKPFTSIIKIVGALILVLQNKNIISPREATQILNANEIPDEIYKEKIKIMGLHSGPGR